MNSKKEYSMSIEDLIDMTLDEMLEDNIPVEILERFLNYCNGLQEKGESFTRVTARI